MQITPIDGTTFGGKLNLDDVEIGDILSPTFKPHIKMKRWNGLCDMAISYPTTSAGLIMYDGVNHILRYPVDNNTDIEIFGIDPDSERPEGAIEFNVILKKRPKKNTITLMLESDSIDFKKILPLDIEYDQAACLDHFPKHTAPFVITPTSITDASGEVLKTRDERLCNSYQGRAKKNYQVKRECGEVKAKSSPYFGKQIIKASVSRTTAHIRRGKAIDADGIEAWVEDMNLGPDGTLTITLPADFIKNATYPIRQAVGLDPAYTEDMDSWVTGGYGDTDGTWTNYDLFTEKGVSKAAVAEIIMANQEAGNEDVMGIRTDGSTIDTNRRRNLHEAEGGGVTTCREFVVCHVSTGLVETRSSDVSDENIFYLVGYWENIAFTEGDDTNTVSVANVWEEWQLNDASAASRVCHFVLSNQLDNTAVTMGVRNTSSAVERKVLVHEPETGGVSFLDAITKADADYKVDIVASSTSGFVDILLGGYFGAELDFTELFQLITNDGDGDWDAEDLTAYLDQDGRVVDFLLTHNDIADPHILGIRDGDDGSTARYIQEHEAEDDGGSTGEVTGFGISAQSNASGVVNLYSDTTLEVFYLMGYFLPAAVGGIDYPISLSPGLTASATVAYKAAWDRTISPGLTVAVVIAYKIAYKRATTPGLTVSATIAKAYGWLVTTTAGLTASATIARKVAYKRAIAPGITAAVTILKGWGRAIATTAGLAVSATVVIKKGFNKALSPGLTVSSTVAYLVAYKRATTPGLTASVTIARKLAYKRAIQAGLTIGVSIVATFVGVTHTLITITSNLTVSATITKGWGRAIATSANLTVSTTISRVVAFKRAISAGLTASVSIARLRARTIVTTANLTISTTISRILAYKRAISVGLAASVSIVRVWGIDKATTANLAVSTTISRVVSYKRVVSTGLAVSIGLTRRWIMERATTTGLTLSVLVDRTVAYRRAISTNLDIGVSIVKSYGSYIATAANLTISVTISYCSVLREFLRIPIDAMDAVRMVASRLVMSRLSSSRLGFRRRRRECSDDSSL